MFQALGYMMGVDFIFAIAILLMSVVIHEVSHGFTALMLGDPTAKYAGRLTLNPLRHLDLWGSIIVPLFLVIARSPVLFGWAKPVPFNPYNLRNQKWGPGIVGIAGPASNILVAIIFGIFIRFGASAMPPAFLQICILIVLINIVLAVFNLIPIPPLDGSKVLFSFLPYRYQGIQIFLERFGFFILLIFIFFFIHLLSPIVLGLFRLITGMGL